MFLIKIIKSVLKLFILIISTYFLTSYLFTFFPTKKSKIENQSLKKIFILYNDMHSDIVIDIDSLALFGTKVPDFKEFAHIIQHRDGYIAFGWGDRETYLNTPTWNDIKLSTTLKALFINTPSVMHIQFYKKIKIFKNLKIVEVSKKQKEILIENILKSFNRYKDSHRGYGKNDFFYPSSYNYNLFNTCNTWTGDRLREANISVSIWTPFSYNVINSLP